MKTVSIPEYWLMGTVQRYRREGMDEKQALAAAIQWWIDQEELEAEYQRQRKVA